MTIHFNEEYFDELMNAKIFTANLNYCRRSRTKGYYFLYPMILNSHRFIKSHFCLSYLYDKFLFESPFFGLLKYFQLALKLTQIPYVHTYNLNSLISILNFTESNLCLRGPKKANVYCYVFINSDLTPMQM